MTPINFNVHGQHPLLYGKNASLAVCVAGRISSVGSQSRKRMVACSTCTSVLFSLDLVLATFLLSESLVKTKKNGDADYAFSALGGGGGGLVGWGRVLPYISLIACASPSGRVFEPF